MSSGGTAQQPIVPDASYSSGQAPDAFGVSAAGVRSELNAAGVGPQVSHTGLYVIDVDAICDNAPNNMDAHQQPTLEARV